MNRATPIAIVGAGYAGLSCAVELALRGFPVSVFESSRTPGGRARVVTVGSLALDNGQHILLGAYRETQRLMRRVGANPDRLLLRQPLSLHYPGEMDLVAAPFVPPLNLLVGLLRAQGLSWAERLAALRLMSALRSDDFLRRPDRPLAAVLAETRQPARLCRLLWEPLCVSALNTPVQSASAHVFANVLRDALFGDARSADMLLPRTDLTRLFPQPAIEWLIRQGHNVLLGRAIRGIVHEADGIRLRVEGELQPERYAGVVIATAPWHAAALLADLPEAATEKAMIDALAWEPIVTAYLAYPPEWRLAAPMVGLCGGLGQWVFDRGQLGGPPGLLAVVISASGRHQALQRDDLAQTLHDELAALLPGLPAPQWTQVIAEKRATFSCVPGLSRPLAQTGIDGLFLCGDYTQSPYPATLESAVRSGVTCAQAIDAASRK
ncbi:MAG: FAD-dependent oxidoreductase [Sterolibacteriaceae bacterium]|nr:FAD-dependent oxidoreductase [Candidatus Methylophosphatis haderslevensis]